MSVIADDMNQLLGEEIRRLERGREGEREREKEINHLEFAVQRLDVIPSDVEVGKNKKERIAIEVAKNHSRDIFV